MQFSNAVKKLKKLGFTVIEPKDPSYPRYTATLGGKHKEIHFYMESEPADAEKPLLGDVYVGGRGSTLNWRMSFGKAIKEVQAKA